MRRTKKTKQEQINEDITPKVSDYDVCGIYEHTSEPIIILRGEQLNNHLRSPEKPIHAV